MIPTHATKNRVRYRYYISRPLQRGHSDAPIGSVSRDQPKTLKSLLQKLFVTALKHPAIGHPRFLISRQSQHTSRRLKFDRSNLRSISKRQAQAEHVKVKPQFPITPIRITVSPNWFWFRGPNPRPGSSAKSSSPYLLHRIGSNRFAPREEQDLSDRSHADDNGWSRLSRAPRRSKTLRPGKTAASVKSI